MTSQAAKVFHLARFSRRLFGVPIRALNLRHGEVADSAFFTNRDIRALTPEAVRWGPSRPDAPARPPLTGTKPKTEGKTPGFFVTDANGARFLVKLNPIDSPELLSGAEVVTSKLLYALGYHVPSYEILELSPDDVRLRPEEARGQAAQFTDEELRRLLESRLREGKVRVSASRVLDGEILGPAVFKRFRDCAEIRALKLAYAWLNNIDAKDHNSLLVWNGRETVGYLIDFGTSLGADAGRAGPKTRCAGWVNIVDVQEIALKVVTFGAHQPTCDTADQAFSPSVGFFSSHIDPDGWKPYAPNLAFDEMNEDDADWIARRMARLSREQIAAAVAAGRYTNPADAVYLVEALVARRDAIVERYLDDDDEESADTKGRKR